MSEEQGNNVTPLRAWRLGGPMTPTQRKEAKVLFLALFAKEANVTLAAENTGIAPKTAYEWRKKDKAFADGWEDAVKASNDMLRGEMWRRGVRGVESYVVSMGRVVYEDIPALDENGKPKLDKHGEVIMRRGNPIVERKYSDTLLMALAKARMPEYQDKQQVDVSTHADAEQVKDLHRAIADALAPFPDARIAVAALLAEKGKAS